METQPILHEDFDEFIRLLLARREMEPEFFEWRRDRAKTELLNPHDQRSHE